MVFYLANQIYNLKMKSENSEYIIIVFKEAKYKAMNKEYKFCTYINNLILLLRN